MMDFPGIFVKTIIIIFFVQFIATLLGWLVLDFLDKQIQQDSKAYLSSTIGLAILTLYSIFLGNWQPFGDSIFVTPLIFTVIIICFILISEKQRMIVYSLSVGLFSIICGSSIIALLATSGAWNPHNDGFTYIAHSNWLQDNAFSNLISINEVTPLNTQIMLYQRGGYRMGASYLFGLIQALSTLRWSYDVYPAVVIVALSDSLLTLGFALSSKINKYSRILQGLILSIPSFLLGGLIFAPNYGFLPQTTGICFLAGFIFYFGKKYALLSDINKISNIDIVRSSILAAILFSATVYCYSEIMPFMIASVIITWIYFYLRAFGLVLSKKFFSSSNSKFLFSFCIFVIFFLNTEIFRAYSAVKNQAGVVVGSPVDWSAFGFLAHVLGLHGGSWDILQWSLPDQRNSFECLIGTITTGFVVCLMIIGFFNLENRSIFIRNFVPTIALIFVFLLAFLYFRYIVTSPFNVGQGQSWSQFKISDWANIFIWPFLILGIISIEKVSERLTQALIVVLFFGGIFFSLFQSSCRVKNIVSLYESPENLAQFYREMREKILLTCPKEAPIYLFLDNEIKLRQMVTYFIPERYVKANWKTDGYIYHYPPIYDQVGRLEIGDCVIQPKIGSVKLISNGVDIGPLNVGELKEGIAIIKDIKGGYSRETSGSDWWIWVERKLTFDVEVLAYKKDQSSILLEFDYGMNKIHSLNIKFIFGDREEEVVLENNNQHHYNRKLPFKSTDLKRIEILTYNEASNISDMDPRKAAFIIRNLKLSIL